MYIQYDTQLNTVVFQAQKLIILVEFGAVDEPLLSFMVVHVLIYGSKSGWNDFILTPLHY